MKIGIMTYFRPVNYGAYLQAYALSHRLNQENDIVAEIIDFHMPEEDDFYKRDIRLQKNLFRLFFCKRRLEVFCEERDKQILSDQSLCSNDISDFISFVDKKYDIIIVGSDELWKVDGYRGFPTAYFLPGNLHCKKVSYAVSGRSPFDNMPNAEVERLRDYLKDFDYFGVRDNATAENVRNLLGMNTCVHLNFDPSFVYDFKPDINNGRRILKQHYGCSGKKKIVALMYNEGRSEKTNLCRYLIEKYGKEYDFISLYNWNYGIKKYSSLTPLEWKDVIASVDGVISTYFHGICFSIIMNKPFLAIDKRAKSGQESKLQDLLYRINGLENYSLDVNTALDEGKLDRFMKNVSNGMIPDYTEITDQARNEFAIFINQLRTISLI